MPISAYQPSWAGLLNPNAGLGPKIGLNPSTDAEDRVGDDRGDERRDERLRLDVVAIQELGAEDGAAERRPEDRPDAGRHPDRDRDPRIARVEVEQAPEVGPEPGADLGGRTLAPAGPARSDRDGRGDQLDERDPAADAARMVVVGGDRRIRAVALRLGREAEDDDARDQATQGDDERERPRPGSVGDRRPALAGG